MKYTITFETDDKEEFESFQKDLKGNVWRSAVHDLMDQFLRPAIKYGNDEQRAFHYEEVRKYIWQCLEDRELSLE